MTDYFEQGFLDRVSEISEDFNVEAKRAFLTQCALTLPEYMRKELAAVLISSTLNSDSCRYVHYRTSVYNGWLKESD